jgi:uncharacterized protein (TIGR00251 family)
VDGPKGGDFRTATLPPWIAPHTNGVVLTLHIQPGARRTAVVGRHGDRLKISVAVAPTDGRANAALIAFLAERIRVPRSRFTLVSGASAREKRIAVTTDIQPQLIARELDPHEGQ